MYDDSGIEHGQMSLDYPYVGRELLKIPIINIKSSRSIELVSLKHTLYFILPKAYLPFFRQCFLGFSFIRGYFAKVLQKKMHCNVVKLEKSKVKHISDI